MIIVCPLINPTSCQHDLVGEMRRRRARRMSFRPLTPSPPYYTTLPTAQHKSDCMIDIGTEDAAPNVVGANVMLDLSLVDTQVFYTGKVSKTNAFEPLVGYRNTKFP